MSNNVTLKLVAGTTYVCAGLPKEVCSRGDTITVSADLAEKLEQDTFRDALNNEHKYWARVEPQTVAADDEDGEAEDGEAEVEKAPTTSRTRKAAAK